MRTQRDRMLAGDSYEPNDPELASLRIVAEERCQRLASLSPRAEAERRLVLVELFARGGDTVGVHPPFRCD